MGPLAGVGPREGRRDLEQELPRVRVQPRVLQSARTEASASVLSPQSFGQPRAPVVPWP